MPVLGYTLLHQILESFCWSHNKIDVYEQKSKFPSIQQFKCPVVWFRGEAIKARRSRQGTPAEVQGSVQAKSWPQPWRSQAGQSRQSPGRSPGKVLGAVPARRSRQGVSGGAVQLKSRVQFRLSPCRGPGAVRRGDPGKVQGAEKRSPWRSPGKVQGAVFRCRAAGSAALNKVSERLFWSSRHGRQVE